MDRLTNEEKELVKEYIENLISNRKSWLQKESEVYAELHYDPNLCYYKSFDEVEDVDTRPVLIDCFRNAVYDFKNKIIEESKEYNMHERDITNKINVIALEKIMNNLLKL